MLCLLLGQRSYNDNVLWNKLSKAHHSLNDLICKSEDRLMTNLERSDLWCFAARGWLGDIPGRRLAAVKQRIWGNFLSPVSGRVELELWAARHSAESHFYKPHNCCHQGVAREAGWAGDVSPGFTTTTPPHKNCSRLFQCSMEHPKYSFKRKL